MPYDPNGAHHPGDPADFSEVMSTIDQMFPAKIVAGPTTGQGEPDFDRVLQDINEYVLPEIDRGQQRRALAFRSSLTNPSGRRMALEAGVIRDPDGAEYELTPGERLTASILSADFNDPQDEEHERGEKVRKSVQSIPGFRTATRLAKNVMAAKAASAIEDGTANASHYRALGEAIHERETDEKARKESSWYQPQRWGPILLDTVEYAMAFRMAAPWGKPAAEGAKGAVAKWIGKDMAAPVERWTAREVASRALPNVAGVAAGTAAELAHPAFAPFVAEQIAQRRVPGYEGHETPQGTFETTINDREPFAESVARGAAQQAIENVTEKMGEAMAPVATAAAGGLRKLLPQKVAGAIDDAAAFIAKKTAPVRRAVRPVTEMTKDFLAKAQFHGAIPEYGEERASDALSYLVGNDPKGGTSGNLVRGVAALARGEGVTDELIQGLGDSASELTAFSMVPGAAAVPASIMEAGARRDANARRRLAYDAWKSGHITATEAHELQSLPVKELRSVLGDLGKAYQTMQSWQQDQKPETERPQAVDEPSATPHVTPVEQQDPKELARAREFYSSPATAFYWTARNPDKAKQLIEGRRKSAAAFEALDDPSLPIIKGTDGDNTLRRQWYDWVKATLNSPPDFLLSARAHEDTQQTVDEPTGHEWTLLAPNAKVPATAAIESFPSPIGTWVRIKPTVKSQQQQEETPAEPPPTVAPPQVQSPPQIEPTVPLPGAGAISQNIQESQAQQPPSQPIYKPGDRVSWTNKAGEQLTGTVRGESDGNITVDTDQIAAHGGVPLKRIETVPPLALQPIGTTNAQPQRETTPPNAGGSPRVADSGREGTVTTSGPRLPEQGQASGQVPEAQAPNNSQEVAQVQTPAQQPVKPQPSIDIGAISEDDLAKLLGDYMTETANPVEETPPQQADTAPTVPEESPKPKLKSIGKKKVAAEKTSVSPQTTFSAVPQGKQVAAREEVVGRGVALLKKYAAKAKPYDFPQMDNPPGQRARDIEVPTYTEEHATKWATAHAPIIREAFNSAVSQLSENRDLEPWDVATDLANSLWEKTTGVTEHDSHILEMKRIANDIALNAKAFVDEAVPRELVKKKSIRKKTKPEIEVIESPGAAADRFPEGTPIEFDFTMSKSGKLNERRQGVSLGREGDMLRVKLNDDGAVIQIDASRRNVEAVQEPKGTIETLRENISEAEANTVKEIGDIDAEIRKLLEGKLMAAGIPPQVVPLVAKRIAKSIKLQALRSADAVLSFAELVQDMASSLGPKMTLAIGDTIEGAWNKLRSLDTSGRMPPAGSVADVLRGMEHGKQDDTAETTPAEKKEPDKAAATEGQAQESAPGVQPGSRRGESDGGARGGNQGGERNADGTLVGHSGESGKPANELPGVPAESENAGGVSQSESGGVRSADSGTGSPGPNGSEGPVSGGSIPGGTTGVANADTGGTAGPARSDKPDHRRNFVINPETILVPPPSKRLKANVRAVQIIAALRAEQRDATPQEQAELVQFTGWGALSKVFDSFFGKALEEEKEGKWNRFHGTEQFDKWKKEFGASYTALKAVMSPEEWSAASLSTLNAHYTSRDIVSATWDAIKRLGFKGGKGLEPSVGIGHFLGIAPADVDIEWTAVDMEPFSAAITAALYPDADVHASPFEQVKLRPHALDIAISNVPFAGAAETPQEAKDQYDDNRLSLHNYFIRRMIDAVRPGGLVVAITSHHTLDANRSNRDWIAARADLVAAIRLPNTAFKSNAGTQVTTDILFFRKRDGGRFDGANSWLELAKVGERVTQQAKGPPKVDEILVNEYFANHPGMVLGEHSLEGSMRGGTDEYTLQPRKGTELKDQIAEAIKLLPQDVLDAVAGEAGPVVEAVGPEAAKETDTIKKVNGTYVFMVDGEEKSLKELSPELDGPKGQVRAHRYMDLKEALVSIVAMQTQQETTNEQLEAARRQLNHAYDLFADAWPKAFADAPVTKTRKIFERERGYRRLLGLELEQSERTAKGGKRKRYVKAQIFRERTGWPVTMPTSADNIDDAIRTSTSVYGRIDPHYVASLMNTTETDVVTRLDQSDAAFMNPDFGIWESRANYLSGNVRQKLKTAQRAVGLDSRYQKNINALLEVQPPHKPIEDISIEMGAPWIPLEVYEGFLRDVMRARSSITLKYLDATASWTLNIPDKFAWHVPADVAVQFGGDGHHALDVFIKAMNRGSSIPVYDAFGVLDLVATNRMAVRLRALTERFTEYVRTERATEAVEAFNANVHHSLPVNYDHEIPFLTFPGSSGEVKPYDYQKRSVLRVIHERRAMLALGVGAGKTYTIVASAMELKRLRLARKPLIVAHNSTLGQFEIAFATMYPSAKVLIADEKSLLADKSDRFLSQIATEDWDAIVIPASGFDAKLKVKLETAEKYWQQQLALVEAAILEDSGDESVGQNGKKRKSPTVKELEKRKQAIRNRLKKLRDRIEARNNGKKKDEFFFEDLGIDFMFLDEAHRYKRPPFFTRIDQNVRGIDRANSERAIDVLLKARFIQGLPGNDGFRGVVALTGTPVTNTLAEAWHQTNIVAPDVLKAYHIELFDAFAGTFASQEQVLTQNSKQQFEFKTYLAKYINGEQFHTMLRSAWEILTTGQLDTYFAEKQDKHLPKVAGGGMQLVSVPLSNRVKAFNAFLVRVVKAMSNLSRDDRMPWADIPMSVMELGKAAALDIRLVYGEQAQADADSKVHSVVREARRIYDETKDTKGTVLVFSDLQNVQVGRIQRLMDFVSFINKQHAKNPEAQIPLNGIEHHQIMRLLENRRAAEQMEKERQQRNKSRAAKRKAGEDDVEQDEVKPDPPKFLYTDIRNALIEGGIKPEEIAIITDPKYKTKEAKSKLFDEVNEGKVRVFIAGTETGGTGVNVQKRAAALFHLDIPKRPSDMTQREGRIVRQGNIYAEEKTRREVEVLGFGMQNTLDSTAYGHLVRKAKMSDQALEGRLGSQFEDPFTEHIMSLAEMQAALTGDKRPIKLVEYRGKLRDLEAQKDVASSNRDRNASALHNYRVAVEQNEKLLAKLKTQQQTFAFLENPDWKGSRLALSGQHSVDFDSPSDFSKKLDEAIDAVLVAHTQAVKDGTKGVSSFAFETMKPDDEDLEGAGTIAGVPVRLYVGVKFTTEEKDGKTHHVYKPRAIFVAGDKHNPLLRINGMRADTIAAALKSIPEQLAEQITLNEKGTADAKKQIAGLEAAAKRIEWTEDQERRRQRMADNVRRLEEAIAADTPFDFDAAEADETAPSPYDVIGQAEAPAFDWSIYDEIDRRLEERAEEEGMPLRAGDVRGAPQAPAPGVLSVSPTNINTGKAGTYALSAMDIIKTWEALFGVTTRAGRFNFQRGKFKAAGLYREYIEAIRAREPYIADLTVNSHEIGHHIAKIHNLNDNWPAGVRDELVQLDPYKLLPGMATNDDPNEGWAEFVRLWMTDEKPQQYAPQTYEWFKTNYGASPEFAKLNQAAEYARAYKGQGAMQRFAAFTRGSLPQPRFGEIGQSKPLEIWKSEKQRIFDRFYTDWKDQDWMLYRVSEAIREGREARDIDTPDEYVSPYELKAFSRMLGPSMANQALEHGVHLITGNRKTISDSLADVLATVANDKELEEAKAYAMARYHEDERKRNPQWQSGLPQEDVNTILRQVESDHAKKAKYQTFHAKLSNFNHSLLLMLADAKVLPMEEVAAMIKARPRYVPWHRVMDHDTPLFGVSRLFSKAKPVHRMTREGSTRPVVDILESTVRRAMYFYTRALNQLVVDRLVRDVDPTASSEAVPGMGKWIERVDPKKIKTMFRIEDIVDDLVKAGAVDAEEAKFAVTLARLKTGEYVKPAAMQELADYLGVNVSQAADPIAALSVAAQANGLFDALTLLSVWRPEYSKDASRNIVVTRVFGDLRVYQLDADVYNATAGDDFQRGNIFAELYARAVHLMKNGAVAFNTFFTGQNAVKDLQSLFHNSKYIPLHKRHLLGIAWTAWYAVDMAKRLAGSRNWNDAIAAYREGGGELHTRIGYDRNDIQRALSFMQRKGIKARIGAVFNPQYLWSNAKEAAYHLSSMVAISDVGPRLAEFIACLNHHGYFEKDGAIVDRDGNRVELPMHVLIRASNAAADVTVNFRRLGKRGKVANRFWPFLNAHLEGIDKFVRTMGSLQHLSRGGDDDKFARQLLLSLLAAAAASWAYVYYRKDDDDYIAQDESFGNRYWTFAGSDGAPLLRLSKPHQFDAIYNTFEQLARWSLGQKTNLKGVALAAAKDAAPGISGPIREVADQLLGYDTYSGMPLEPAHLQRLPPFARKDENTSQLSQAISSYFYQMTGSKSLSPMRLDHAINAAVGGMFERNKPDGKWTMRDVPFIGSFSMRKDVVADVRKFYDQYKELEQQYALEKADLGEATEPTKIAYDRADDYAGIMTSLRQAKPPNYELYIIGLARYANGEDELDRYPNPLTDEKAPIEVRKIVAAFVKKKMDIVLGHGPDPDAAAKTSYVKRRIEFLKRRSQATKELQEIGAARKKHLARRAVEQP